MARITEYKKRYSMQVMNSLPVSQSVVVQRTYMVTNCGDNPFPRDTVFRCVAGLTD